MAGKLVKNAGPEARRLIDESRPRIEKAVQEVRPKVEKAVEQYRPRVEQAGRDAVRYAQEHQEELKSLAIKGARTRMGPLGMAIDALGLDGRPGTPAAVQCPSCKASNAASARFCSECGASLPGDETPGQDGGGENP
jgi:hypothetical protein